MVDINGFVPAKYSAVRDAFAANFKDTPKGLPDGFVERGARFTVVIAGETVLDLWGGSADRDQAVPYSATTLNPVFSTGKAVMAFLFARLVDQGKIDYDTKISKIWPEFGQAGKDKITLGQLISHQGGLPGFRPSQEPTIWFDTEAVSRVVEKQEPLWKPGTASGYHPILGGYVLNEVFRRVDGRTLGTAQREDLAKPFELDVMIGTPDSEEWRVPYMQKPYAMPELGPIDDIKRAAFLDKGSSPAGKGNADWRRMEIPSANCHATALGLARLMGAVATGGYVGVQRVISLKALGEATRERIAGQDKVLPFRLSWGAGFLRNKGIGIYGPNERSVGHSGWGGSCAFADPDKKVSAAYVMNRQSAHLFGDPRPLRLIEALYKSL